MTTPRDPWRKTRPGHWANSSQRVFRIALRGEVENPEGRYFAAVRRDGTPVESHDLGLPFEGIHRFTKLGDAQWHLAVHDQED